MNVQNSTSDYSLYYQQTTITMSTDGKTSTNDLLAAAKKYLDYGATVYDKSTDSKIAEKSNTSTDGKTVTNKNTPYPIDKEKVQSLIDEAKRGAEKLLEVVQKTLSSQANTQNTANGLFKGNFNFVGNSISLQNGGFKAVMQKVASLADKDTVDWAKEQVSENGYYGVNKTSDRLVEFAKALTGGDPSKIDTMKKAIKQGFDVAEKAWGDKLPDISKKTYEATMKKLDDWAAENKTVSNSVLAQAGASVVAQKAA